MQLIHGILVVCFISCGWASTLHDGTDRLSNGSVMNHDGLQDPIELLEMVYPLDNSLEKPPVKLSAEVRVRHGGYDLFNVMYGNMSVCFEVNSSAFDCSGVHNVWKTIELQELGSFTVRAYLSDVNDEGKPIGKQHRISRPITFTVVGDDELASHIAECASGMQTKHRAGYDLSLVDWASQQKLQRPDALLAQLEKENADTENRGNENEDLLLLIGVKTAIATNFPLRQAIRETWANKDSLLGVKVIFIGCRPFTINEDSSSEADVNETEQRRLRDAIELERMTYGDFLTDELSCNDMYNDLANKVKEFLHVAATQYSHAQYVMIADDDLYLRVDELVMDLRQRSSHRRYYGGQVLSIQNALHKNVPTRDKNVRCSLPEADYPLSEFPPFAMGAYFFLSMDCVEFISRNYRRLRDLGGMDDITIAMWMLVIQVHPQHYKKLGFLRSNPCNDNFVAYGDLSALAIREVHLNLMENRAFCHGFERNLWFKSSGHNPIGGIYRKLPSFSEPLKFEFAVENLENDDPVQIVTTISTLTQAGIKMPYTPSLETFSTYSRRVCAESRLNFPSAVSSSSCYEITSNLRSGLVAFTSIFQQV